MNVETGKSGRHEQEIQSERAIGGGGKEVEEKSCKCKSFVVNNIKVRLVFTLLYSFLGKYIIKVTSF